MIKRNLMSTLMSLSTHQLDRISHAKTYEDKDTLDKRFI